MKVLQISAMNYSSKSYNSRKNNTNDEVTEGTQPSFKGLWGEPETTEDYTSTYSVHDTQLPYYPFKDETKEEIDEIVKKHSHSNDYCADSKVVADPIPWYEGTFVSVMAALPFTAKDFQDFLQKKVSDLKKQVIESHILEKNLRVK